ncbi:MAG: hypothetical protein ABIQ44_12645 [Chloroflexia bacterium]
MKTWSSTRYELPAIALLSALLTTIVFFTTLRITRSFPLYNLGTMDHHRYVMMAEGNPFDFHLAPFSWRILMPALVKLLPFGTEIGFLLITLICLCLSGVLLYYIVRAAGFTYEYSLFGILLFFSMGWLTKQYIFDFWLPDVPAIAFILAAIYAIYKKHDLLFLVLLTIGVLAKETVIFVIPLYYSLNALRLFDWPLLRRTTLFAIPPAIILILLRLAIPALNGDPAYLALLPATMTLNPIYEQVPYSFAYMLQTIGAERLQGLTPYNVGYRYLIFPLNVAPLALPLLALRQVAPVLLRYSPYLILVYAQLLIAANTERLVSLAFPPLIIMSVVAVRKVMTDLKLKPLWALLLPTSLFLLGTLDTDPEWSYLSTSWQFIIVLISFALLAFVFVYRRNEARNSISSA